MPLRPDGASNLCRLRVTSEVAVILTVSLIFLERSGRI
jgi:hypothetical protein